jgi:hypothetical protein
MQHACYYGIAWVVLGHCYGLAIKQSVMSLWEGERPREP